MLLRIVPSEKPFKRFKAVFRLESGKLKEVHFGQKGGTTYIDKPENAEKRRQNYIKRHQPREEIFWKQVGMSPASLARFILWNKPTLEESIEDYRRRFGY